jgi:hypothetical protein
LRFGEKQLLVKTNPMLTRQMLHKPASPLVVTLSRFLLPRIPWDSAPKCEDQSPLWLVSGALSAFAPEQA